MNAHSEAPDAATRAQRAGRPRRIVLVGAAAAAATLLAINLASPAHQTATPPPRHVVAPNMQQIAESTSAALTSGRAHLTYSSDNKRFIHESGVLTIEFAGDNRSTVGTIDPGNPCTDGSASVTSEPCDSPPFDVANRVVDGTFYLRDGAPGQQKWVEDTKARLSGTDLFSADPRTLMGGATQDAGFVEAGSVTVDGVATRHLTATHLDRVPAVNLGLGPVTDNNTTVTKFDVWVDADNVVRRLDIATSQTQTVQPVTEARGQTASQRANLQKALDERQLGPTETLTLVSNYSVVFSDIGAPIDITAPANATKVAGKG